jgi:hypothetical protein
MIPSASAPTLHRVTDAAAILTLAAVGAALILPDPYAAVPDQLRPGAWSQDTISAPAALALLALNARIRGGWRKGRLNWAGLVGYLIYAYGLYTFDRVMNPAYPLYLAILSLLAVTALLLWRGDPVGDLLAIPMLMKVAVLGVSVFLGTFYSWAAFDGTLLPFDLALYALMGFGPAALILPVWRRQKVEGRA